MLIVNGGACRAIKLKSLIEVFVDIFFFLLFLPPSKQNVPPFVTITLVLDNKHMVASVFWSQVAEQQKADTQIPIAGGQIENTNRGHSSSLLMSCFGGCFHLA